MHYHLIEDADGNLLNVVPFCSDFCHRTWCYQNAQEYGGWNGCHEGADYDQECEQCGEHLPGIQTQEGVV